MILSQFSKKFVQLLCWLTLKLLGQGTIESYFFFFLLSNIIIRSKRLSYWIDTRLLRVFFSWKVKFVPRNLILWSLIYDLMMTCDFYLLTIARMHLNLYTPRPISFLQTNFFFFLFPFCIRKIKTTIMC